MVNEVKLMKLGIVSQTTCNSCRPQVKVDRYKIEVLRFPSFLKFLCLRLGRFNHFFSERGEQIIKV